MKLFHRPKFGLLGGGTGLRSVVHPSQFWCCTPWRQAARAAVPDVSASRYETSGPLRKASPASAAAPDPGSQQSPQRQTRDLSGALQITPRAAAARAWTAGQQRSTLASAHGIEVHVWCVLWTCRQSWVLLLDQTRPTADSPVRAMSSTRAAVLSISACSALSCRRLDGGVWFGSPSRSGSQTDEEPEHSGWFQTCSAAAGLQQRRRKQQREAAEPPAVAASGHWRALLLSRNTCLISHLSSMFNINIIIDDLYQHLSSV